MCNFLHAEFSAVFFFSSFILNNYTITLYNIKKTSDGYK